MKLKLKESKLSELDATIRVLGKLPNLAILRLKRNPFEGEELQLTFHREAFPSLMVLQLHGVGNLESVEFEQGAAARLELLLFSYAIRRAKSILLNLLLPCSSPPLCILNIDVYVPLVLLAGVRVHLNQ